MPVVWIQDANAPRLSGGACSATWRGAPVLAADREPLQQARADQNDRRRDADGIVVRQEADQSIFR